MRMIRRIINIVELRQEERKPVAVAALLFIILNAINVCAYWYNFSIPTEKYHALFVNTYRVSGFDPLTYEVISDWFPAYNIYRHPLLAFFMWPLYLVNHLLMTLTSINFATILTAMVLVVCSTYSFVFLYRILRNVIGVSYWHTIALAGMYFSFGFTLLSSFAPDHFVMSQCCLLLTIWLGGEKLKRGSALNMWQTIALFTLTAGISLNNGLKVFLAAMVTRRWRFFRWKYLLLAVVLPSAVIWGFARWEYRTWQLPKFKHRQEIKMQKDRKATALIRQQVTDTIANKDKAAIDKAVARIKQQRAEARYSANRKLIWNRNTGKPFAKGEFMQWTDRTTSRWDTAVENLFGEGIQLHRDYPLCDVLRNRPVFVRYSGPWRYANYAVEGMIVALFLCGIWCGRRRLFLWTAMSFFIMDMTLHMGLGFGINEIYIMSVHYLFVIPIAAAYLVKQIEGRKQLCRSLTVALSALALWCFAWNMTIICSTMAT